MILASASPRRAAILKALGIDFRVQAANLPESAEAGETAEEVALRLCLQKAVAVADEDPAEWVLGGDTVVTIDNDVLGKPEDDLEAVRMLMRLQGCTHRVVSALALVGPKLPSSPVSTFTGTQVTAVTFRPFGVDTARAYVRTGEPFDKAGAYGIQGKGAALVDRIDGDYTGVVGLPVPLLLSLLEQAGRPYRFTPSDTGD